MMSVRIAAAIGFLLLLCVALPHSIVQAQNKPQVVNQASGSSFELKDGDRVVFLGNSLFENDLQYGYLEFALTTRWPDRDITFRNIGWTGDNVFGDARNEFTNPPTAYEMLMEQITKAQPTVVFLAYGGIEAQEGEPGLTRFKDGLNKLLDKIDGLGARSVLLSPIPVMLGDSVLNGANRNGMLQVYAAAIAETAFKRGKPYIDVFKPMQALSRQVTLTDNGIHLNEAGYYQLAVVLQKGLGLTMSNEIVSINTSKNGAQVTGSAKMLGSSSNSETINFTINEPQLPLLLPAENGPANAGQMIRISGLKKGFYTLTVDKTEVITASAKKWAEGVSIQQGPAFDQACALQQMILKKNELHFFQYRPLNRTYILGFRSYEQGRHVKGLEEQNILIKWLEGQIAQTRAPKSRVYQLTLLKQ